MKKLKAILSNIWSNHLEDASWRNLCHGGCIYRHIRNSVLRNEARPGTKTSTNQEQMQQMQQMQMQPQI